MQRPRAGPWRLPAPRLKTVWERRRELAGVGEEGESEGVSVVGEEEEEDGEEAGGVGEGDWLLGSDREEEEEAARCSRRRRWRRRVEERSSASAVRPQADRLASRALAWLGEAVREATAPSWPPCLLRPSGAAAPGSRLEKIPEMKGSMLLLLVLGAFRWSRSTGDREEGGRFPWITGGDHE